MSNIDNFKSFVKKNPTLVTHVREGNMSWQKFYELYDLYGEDESIWSQYLIKKETREIKNTEVTTNSTLSNLIEMAKNLDTNKLQNGITSIQKAINLFGDILIKDKTDETNTYTPRPVYRRFDD